MRLNICFKFVLLLLICKFLKNVNVVFLYFFNFSVVLFLWYYVLMNIGLSVFDARALFFAFLYFLSFRCVVV